jgi:hypothetical protein
LSKAPPEVIALDFDLISPTQDKEHPDNPAYQSETADNAKELIQSTL